MRIIFLNWRDLAHPRAGGAEVLAQGIARRLARDAHEVTFFSAAVDGAPPEETRDGVRHVRRGGRLGVYMAARAWLRQERPQYDILIDHINTVPFFSPLYDRHRTIALVPQLARDVWLREAPPGVAQLGLLSERAYHVVYQSTPAITISQSTERDLRDFGWRGPIRTIAMPIPAPPDVLPDKHERPALLFVGRLTPSKRVEDAIAAFGTVRERIPDAELWIAGQADDLRYRARLENIAKQIGNVDFLGRLTDAERQQRMAQAHLLVATSVREGWGLVVTEANSVGTPAAGYDVPGLRDSIKPGRGILSVAGDPGALGNAMIRVLSDPAELAEMSAHARRDATQYSWQRTYDEFVAALRELAPPEAKA
ncbi:MAG: glycosyltransferase family 4 protein [Candidatus Eremiobacteraeota bacterium]|nr:glycosyltransferase family 4 protein [Candidatus Eremiobacteraeota bacterium]